MNLSKNVQITRVMNGVVAGTDDTQSGTVLDMANWDGVVFIGLIGAITATGTATLQAQQGTLANGSDMATLTGDVDYTADDGNKAAVLDVYRPQERYVRAQIVRATANVVIDGVIAIQYKGRKGPVTNGATVVGTTLAVSPAEAA